MHNNEPWIVVDMKHIAKTLRHFTAKTTDYD